MKYSPLCDTDLVAYLAFIASASCNGSSSKQPLRVAGRGRVHESGNSSDHDGGRVVGVFRGLLDEARRGVDEVDRGFTTDRIDSCVRDLTGSYPRRRAIANVGVAGGDDGGGFRGVGDSVSSGCSGEVECERQFVPVNSHASVVNVSARTVANRAKRLKGKARKARKRQSQEVDSGVDLPSGEDSSNEHSEAVVPEWRRGSVQRSGVLQAPGGKGKTEGGWQGAGSGFWNSCSGSVRQQLIDSKARMHIAENERKAAEARNRVEYLESPRAIADQVVKLATQLEKQTGLAQSNAVAGWAQTVISSSAEGIAKSAPSSAPSFDTYLTERSEAEEKRASQLKAQWEEQAKKDDEEERERRARENQVVIDREVEARCETEIHNRVAKMVHSQIQTKIAEFERKFRQSHIVVPRDTRTGPVGGYEDDVVVTSRPGLNPGFGGNATRAYRKSQF